MKFLLLDRDGTIIVDRSYMVDLADIQILPGVIEGLTRFRDHGVRFFVVSNQSGIGRKLFTAEHVRAFNAVLDQQLRERGIRIEAFEFCPHVADDGCACRKPKIGMWKVMRERFPELSASEAVMVGDKDEDVLFGRTIGCTTARIFSTQYPRTIAADFLVRSIDELSGLLLAPADRIRTIAEAATMAEQARAHGRAVVTTNGAFDLFHAGHRFLIEEAHKHGDFLIIGINSDASVRRAKGEGRPVQNEETRARMVARYADAVFIFDDDDPRPWLLKIRPQAHVNAQTYGGQCIERPVLDQIRAKLILVPVKVELGSTTQFLSSQSPAH